MRPSHVLHFSKDSKQFYIYRYKTYLDPSSLSAFADLQKFLLLFLIHRMALNYEKEGKY